MDPTEHTFGAPLERKGMRLTEISYDRIRTTGMNELVDICMSVGIEDDECLSSTEDLRERLILLKRKMEGCSNKWKHLFRSLQEESKTKIESLTAIMRTVESTLSNIPIDSLSEILRKEGHLKNQSLLQEISKRMENLINQRRLIVIAGETNGGKSTFLNLLLGEDILPTDVLHCTFVVCKIVYSEVYSIKTLDQKDQAEHFTCSSREEVKMLLKSKVAPQDIFTRTQESPIKEITLGLPADILKSGVILVDTPGIGEDEKMDDITLNYIKSNHVSAFIYVIKSDNAGGVQEDRLLGFLRAIKEKFYSDPLMESFDPRAAMFVCHRWDNIQEEQREKVKNNALNKLEYMWPGFDASQTYFFSTRDTMKHLPADPEFVTDSFMELLTGLKHLFDRARQNALKHQYIWLKYMLQQATRHLKSMITHCIHNNEELDRYFNSVTIKQNKLLTSSAENSKKIQDELDKLSLKLKAVIKNDLHFDRISPRMEINDCEEIIEACSKENFLSNKANRHLLDEMIIRSLLKYVEEHIHERNLVIEMESQILQAIQDHLGLFRCQISHIKGAMLHGGNFSLTPNSSRSNIEIDDNSIMLGASTVSSRSASSSVEAFVAEMILDPSQLATLVKGLLKRRKDGKLRRSITKKHEIQESLLSKLKGKIISVFNKTSPEEYVEERIVKVARDIREDEDVMDSIAVAYTEWIQQCVNYATNSIPKFIDVNNKLMEEIREHRSMFQKNKDALVKVMENLEPIRHHLKGYGLLYMDDINAEMLAFNMERNNSSVIVPSDIIADHRRHDDSGFQGSGSSEKHVLRITQDL